MNGSTLPSDARQDRASAGSGGGSGASRSAGQAAGGGPLENIANNSSPGPSARAEKRDHRYALRALLWRLSTLRRLRHCGRVHRGGVEAITVRNSDIGAGFAGLQHCGSVWTCPVCSAQILTHRALEIGAVLGQAVAEGYSLGFVTFTMRHRQGQALEALWRAAGTAWGRSTSGKAWVDQSGRYGVVGWVRVWEVTQGSNGWHVHVHFVLVLAPGATSADLDAVASGMYERWSRGLQSEGLEAPLRVGQKWELAGGDDAAGSLAEYLFKITETLVPQRETALSLGLELTHTLPGRSRSDHKTRPVWSLLDDFSDTGDAEVLARWHEWERGSKGKRQVGWSKGLRERFVPELEVLTDEEVADREAGSSADDLVSIPLVGWRELVKSPHELPVILTAAERAGTAGVVEVLERLQVPYSVVTHRGPVKAEERSVP